MCPFIFLLSYFCGSSRSCTISRTADCHSRGRIRYPRCSFSVRSRELAGRRAAVGYSAEVIAVTAADGPPASSLTVKISCARPHQLVLPALTKRSEEHTSELQSLMRISYAVFCLKKKHTENTCSSTIDKK